MKLFACAWLDIAMIEMYADDRPDADDIINTRPTVARTMRQLITKVVDELLDQVNEDLDKWISLNDVRVVFGDVRNGATPVEFHTKAEDTSKASTDTLIGKGNIWELEV